MADGQDGQVEVYSPEGKRGFIPASQADDAVKQGYKRADEFIRAIHPTTGKTGLIPKEQWGDAQLQGYMLHPSDQARLQLPKIQAGTPPLSQSGTGLLPDQIPDPKTGQMPPPADAGATLSALPSAGGAVGGALGGIPGAAIGGAIGEAGKQLLAPLGNVPRSETPGQDIAVSGAEQGALEGVGQGVSKVAETLAPKIIKAFIKPTEQMFAYGKDPVKFVSEMKGGIPGDKAALAKQVFQELEDTGNQITSKLKEVEKMFPNAPGINSIDVGRVINDPIDKKIAEISADRGMEASVKKGVIERLEDLRSGIMTNAAGKAQPTVMKLSEANTLKQQIGKGTNWKISADPIESKAQPILNGLRKEIYSGIRKGIEQKAEAVGVQGLKEVNLKYGSGLDALKSIEKRMNSGPMLTMSDVVTAIASPTAAIVKKGLGTAPGAIGASKALRSVGTKAGGAGVSNLLRVIAGMLESSPGQAPQEKQ